VFTHSRRFIHSLKEPKLIEDTMGSFTPPLDKSVGYGVVIGLGFLFAFGMILTTFILKRYNYELQTSEMFSTAGRTVKSGLVSAAVVSSWTWVCVNSFNVLQGVRIPIRYIFFHDLIGSSFVVILNV